MGRRRTMRRAFNGGLVRGRMHPTVTSASPWNSYTLTSTWTAAKETDAGVVCFLASQLRTGIRGELGLDGAKSIDLRLLRVDVWVPPTLATSDRNFIVLSPSDWTTQDSCSGWSQINWYEGWGTAVQPAHVHYVWPKSISTIVLPYQDDFALFRFDIKAKCQYIIKFHVLWRVSNPDPRPTAENVGVLHPAREHLRSPPSQEGFVDLSGLASLSPLA